LKKTKIITSVKNEIKHENEIAIKYIDPKTQQPIEPPKPSIIFTTTKFKKFGWKKSTKESANVEFGVNASCYQIEIDSPTQPNQKQKIKLIESVKLPKLTLETSFVVVDSHLVITSMKMIQDVLSLEFTFAVKCVSRITGDDFERTYSFVTTADGLIKDK